MFKVILSIRVFIYRLDFDLVVFLFDVIFWIILLYNYSIYGLKEKYFYNFFIF